MTIMTTTTTTTTTTSISTTTESRETVAATRGVPLTTTADTNTTALGSSTLVSRSGPPTNKSTTIARLATTSTAAAFFQVVGFSCQAPLCALPTAALCRDAATYFNATDQTVSQQSKTSKPPGCWVTAAGRLQFNNAIDAASNVEELMYCRRCGGSTTTTPPTAAFATSIAVSTNTPRTTTNSADATTAPSTAIRSTIPATTTMTPATSQGSQSESPHQTSVSGAAALFVEVMGAQCQSPHYCAIVSAGGCAAAAAYLQTSDLTLTVQSRPAQPYGCYVSAGGQLRLNVDGAATPSSNQRVLCQRCAARTTPTVTSSSTLPPSTPQPTRLRTTSLTSTTTSEVDEATATTTPATATAPAPMLSTSAVAWSTSAAAPTCPEDKLSFVGDGFCDTAGWFNTLLCGWDGGDCCAESCAANSNPNSTTAGTLLLLPFACGTGGYTCADPAFRVHATTAQTTAEDFCNYVRPASIGDGYCDDAHAGANTHKCAWDGGDCCIETCLSATYVCGANNGYVCRDETQTLSNASTAAASTATPTLTTTGAGGSTSSPYNSTLGSCAVTPSQAASSVGDGLCDAATNTARCNWDGGDCCASTCRQQPEQEEQVEETEGEHAAALVQCGSGGGYVCRDPVAADAENYECRDQVNTTTIMRPTTSTSSSAVVVNQACFTLYSLAMSAEECEAKRAQLSGAQLAAAATTHFVDGLGWDIRVSAPHTAIVCGSVFVHVVYARRDNSTNWMAIPSALQALADAGTEIVLTGIDLAVPLQVWRPLMPTPLPSTTTTTSSSSSSTTTTTHTRPTQYNLLGGGIAPETWTAIYVGIGVAALIIIVIIVVVAVLCCKKHKRLRDRKDRNNRYRVGDDERSHRHRNLPPSANSHLRHLETKPRSTGMIEMQSFSRQKQQQQQQQQLDRGHRHRYRERPGQAGLYEEDTQPQQQQQQQHPADPRRTSDVELDFGGDESKAAAFPRSRGGGGGGYSVPRPLGRNSNGDGSTNAHDDDDGGGGGGGDDVVAVMKSKLVVYFTVIGKTKFIAKIPEILRRNRGKERRLCLKLVRKYGGYIDTSDIKSIIAPTRSASIGGPPTAQRQQQHHQYQGQRQRQHQHQHQHQPQPQHQHQRQHHDEQPHHQHRHQHSDQQPTPHRAVDGGDGGGNSRRPSVVI